MDVVKQPETDPDKDQTESSSSERSKESGFENFDSSALHYVDGKCFYRDPSGGVEYEWNEEKKEWLHKTASEKDYVFDGETYFYTDKTTNVKYKWDKDKEEWKAGGDEGGGISLVVEEAGGEEMDSDEDEGTAAKKSVVRQDMSKGTYGTDGDTLTYTDPADGTVYLWDKAKSAWFPKVDDDFLAQYQLSYGFTNPGDKPDDGKEEKKEEEAEKKGDLDETETSPAATPESAESLKRKAPEPPAWFEVSDETNNKVYVSNLPTELTESEFVDLMQKCGLVMKDPDSGKMKVKLYTERDSERLKGDALCTYIKVESVELALTVLDGYEYKGKKIHVERAKFTMKGSSYDPSLRPKKKKRKDKEKIKKMQEKLFDWRPEKIIGERAKNEKVVIVKNLFDPVIFDREVSLILEYTEDLREECKKCGDLKKVLIHDRHPEGVAQIWFKEFEGAEACVQLLNGRWFGQRRISAEIWDGKTKYKIHETEADIEKRIQNWDKFLGNEAETEGKSGEAPPQTEGEKEKIGEEKTEEVPMEDEEVRERAEGADKGREEAVDRLKEEGADRRVEEGADRRAEEGADRMVEEGVDRRREEGADRRVEEEANSGREEGGATEGERDSDATRSSAGSGDDSD